MIEGKENTIREWLVPQLQSMGLTPEQFANMVGISRASLYFYFTDRSRPDTGTMAVMCEVLGVPLEEGLRQYIPKQVGRPSGRRNRVKRIPEISY